MVTRNALGQVTVTREGVSESDLMVTATATRVALGAWDFVATDAMGRFVAATTLKSYSAVLRAFELLGM